MFNKNLRAIRLQKELSQKQVADYLNVSPQSVSKWEKGEALPSIEYLPKLAECFGVDINALFYSELSQTNNNDVLKDFLALTNKSGDSEENTGDEINEFICEHPDIIDITITFCKGLMEYKTISSKALQGVLNCSDEEVSIFINYLVASEIIEKLDVENTYFVVKHVINDFIVFLKIKQAIYEKSIDDSYDFVDSLLKKLNE